MPIAWNLRVDFFVPILEIAGQKMIPRVKNPVIGQICDCISASERKFITILFLIINQLETLGKLW